MFRCDFEPHTTRFTSGDDLKSFSSVRLLPTGGTIRRGTYVLPVLPKAHKKLQGSQDNGTPSYQVEAAAALVCEDEPSSYGEGPK
jgi:hypothetical protein